LPSKPDRAGWLRGVTYAHRGLHGQGRIENSPSAFRAALAAGLGIECDVQLTADDEALVFHDWDLDRLTAKQGPVRGRTLEMLSHIPLNSGEAIWTLAELLAEVGGRVPVLVEIKSRREAPCAPLCRAVRRALAGYSGPIAVMSFDPNVARWFADNAPDLVRGLVVTEDGQPGAFAASRAILVRRFARAEFIAFDVRDLPSPFAAAMRKRGLPLLTWTVSTPALLARGREHADGWIAEGEGLT
jgi:glycerophosphoryl diester phosphodiesterase